MTHILYCHDSDGFAQTKAEIFTDQGYQTEAFETVVSVLERIKRGVQNIDVVILHKDMGDYSKENIPNAVDKIVQALHEENETIRIGIISGEYPNGKKHVLLLGADFYFETATSNDNPWLLSQLDKGPVTPKELLKRTREVSTPEQVFSSTEKKY